MRFPSSPLEPRLEQPESGLYATVSEGRRQRRSGVRRRCNTAISHGTARTGPYRSKAGARQLSVSRNGRPFRDVLSRDLGNRGRSDLHVPRDRRSGTVPPRDRELPQNADVRSRGRGDRADGRAGAGNRMGLRPVATMASRIEAIEAGRRERMGEDYPPELSGLARNIDRFIDHEISSRDRYRTAMDDLAHSLKTPLAVFRNALYVRTGRGPEAVARTARPDGNDGSASAVARDGGAAGGVGRLDRAGAAGRPFDQGASHRVHQQERRRPSNTSRRNWYCAATSAT